ncbi:MAG: ribosome small subunit-dependent GTPase A [Anaerolineaceae bacterium]|nr:ribosome small subunit-dependent GTPase A [Anaerolineaceae bacterium]
MTQPDLLDGLVISDQSGYFNVEVTDGTIYTCRLRGRLQEEAQASDIAAIGDRVQIRLLEDGSGTIETVAERSSTLSRAVRTEGSRGAGQREREQVIIANADQALFVFAATQPPPNLRLLDRFLVMGESSRIPLLCIVVNKIDLEDSSLIRATFAPYEAMGYPVLYSSARDKLGVDEIQAILKDKISVFTGPSGVGKTSLLNIIQPGLGRTVKEVSRRRQEGMHTTRDSALIKLEMGGYLADTPGLRTLTIWDVEPEELDGYFVDVAPYVGQCKFNNCAHINEPDCAVRQAVEGGKISASRYQSYQALRQELEAAYAL